jgi:hypothetical protein
VLVSLCLKCYHREMKDLNKKALGGLLFLILAMAALLFVPAWTLNGRERA